MRSRNVNMSRTETSRRGAVVTIRKNHAFYGRRDFLSPIGTLLLRNPPLTKSNLYVQTDLLFDGWRIKHGPISRILQGHSRHAPQIQDERVDRVPDGRYNARASPIKAQHRFRASPKRDDRRNINDRIHRY